jgi:hypothetical protein
MTLERDCKFQRHPPGVIEGALGCDALAIRFGGLRSRTAGPQHRDDACLACLPEAGSYRRVRAVVRAKAMAAAAIQTASTIDITTARISPAVANTAARPAIRKSPEISTAVGATWAAGPGRRR